MKQRVITGIIFTIVVAAFVIPSYWFPLLMVLFALIVGVVASVEMVKALRSGNMRPSAVSIIAGGVIALLDIVITYVMKEGALFALTLYLLTELCACLITAIVPLIIRDEKDALGDGIRTGATILYITFPLYCLCTMSLFCENGWFYMVAGLFSPWISDVFAYFTGVMFGKHKIVPHISPKKTWEGCIGGALFCSVVVMLYFDIVIYKLDGISMNIVGYSFLMFVLGFVISAMSQIGDWLASAIKRQVGIKDYGKFMPGHGGMLDRFDSTFFTLPIGMLIAVIAMYI